jgi:hypothetical protein
MRVALAMVSRPTARAAVVAQDALDTGAAHRQDGARGQQFRLVAADFGVAHRIEHDSFPQTVT